MSLPPAGPRKRLLATIVLLVIVVGVLLATFSVSPLGAHVFTALFVAPTATEAPTATFLPAPPTETPTPTWTPTPTATDGPPTPTPTISPWQTIQTFTGTGIKNTDAFSVPGRWRVLWTCDATSFPAPFSFAVFLDTTAGKDISTILSTQCKVGNTSDASNVFKAGTFSLHVSTNGAWTIQVQVPD